MDVVHRIGVIDKCSILESDRIWVFRLVDDSEVRLVHADDHDVPEDVFTRLSLSAAGDRVEFWLRGKDREILRFKNLSKPEIDHTTAYGRALSDHDRSRIFGTA